MKVYVESNFVLQLALQQEQFDACEQILQEAEKGRIRLAISAHALLEPSATIHRRASEWDGLAKQVDRALDHFVRTRPIQEEARVLQNVFVRMVQLAATEFGDVHRRILAAAQVIPVDARILRDADTLRDECGLKLDDAVVLACVLSDLDFAAPSLFVTTDRKDFGDPTVKKKLRDGGCELIGRIEHGAARIRNSLDE